MTEYSRGVFRTGLERPGGNERYVAEGEWSSGSRPLPRSANSWLWFLAAATLAGSAGQHGRDLRKDRADAGRDARHDSAGSHGHETRHQSVFDEVLTARVFDHSELQNQILHVSFISSPYLCATGPCRCIKVIIGGFQLESGLNPNAPFENSQDPDLLGTCNTLGLVVVPPSIGHRVSAGMRNPRVMPLCNSLSYQVL